MPIPESQLETWAHQGATVTAKATHEAVRRALAADSSPIKGKEYEVYLQGLQNQQYVEGIVFYTLKEQRQVINYPKLHYENGVKKNSDTQTNGWFKPTVRVFKNARSYLIDQHIIDGKVAPSYFVESYIYNAPAGLFGSSHGQTFAKVLNWVAQPSGQLTCQNGVVP